MKMKNLLAEALKDALNRARDEATLNFQAIPEFSIDRPANPAFGDFSINLAMMVAGQAGLPPRQVAQITIDHLTIPDHMLERVEVAGPGFINFYLKPAWLQEEVREIHMAGEAYGRSNFGRGKHALVEYVSANPNGPLSIAHGRGAIIGDTLCNVLETAGFLVTREFYVNDAAVGIQMVRFGESLLVRYLQEFGKEIELPEEGYYGEYVREFARKIKERDGDKYLKMPVRERLTLFTEMGKEAMIEWQHELLEQVGVEFDSWFRESSLLESGAVDEAMEGLKESGATYEAEGALWLSTMKFGDDKDRPLVRSNGKPTYFAYDIAYHRNKFERGYDSLIDIWGHDHYSYIARTKAAMSALGYSSQRLNIIIFQNVRLSRGGEPVVAGRRRDDINLLSELIEQAGKDAIRYFLLLKNSDSEINVDLELIAKKSADNPLYFVQHAHARIAGIIRTAKEKGITIPDPHSTDLSSLVSETEISLIRRLTDFPEEIIRIAELYEPYRLTQYAANLAREFHAFYDSCPVLKEGTPAKIRDARLILVSAAGITLKNVLKLIDVSAPDSI